MGIGVALFGCGVVATGCRARVLAGRAETGISFGFPACRLVCHLERAGSGHSAATAKRMVKQAGSSSALAGPSAFLRRVDGNGPLRRRAASRRAEHASALEFESGDFELRWWRNSENAGAGAGARTERRADSQRGAMPPLRRCRRTHLRGNDW